MKRRSLELPKLLAVDHHPNSLGDDPTSTGERSPLPHAKVNTFTNTYKLIRNEENYFSRVSATFLRLRYALDRDTKITKRTFPIPRKSSL